MKIDLHFNGRSGAIGEREAERLLLKHVILVHLRFVLAFFITRSVSSLKTDRMFRCRFKRENRGEKISVFYMHVGRSIFYSLHIRGNQIERLVLDVHD